MALVAAAATPIRCSAHDPCAHSDHMQRNEQLVECPILRSLLHRLVCKQPLMALSDDEKGQAASAEQRRSAVIAELEAVEGVLSLRNLGLSGESLASLLDAYLLDDECRQRLRVLDISHTILWFLGARARGYSQLQRVVLDGNPVLSHSIDLQQMYSRGGGEVAAGFLSEGVRSGTQRSNRTKLMLLAPPHG